MKKIKVLIKILRFTNVDKVLYGFIAFFFVMAFFIMLVEPNINSIGESIWYCYVVVSTIGFGDYVAVTIIGRTLSIGLSIYSIFMLALIPGVLVSFFTELMKLKTNDQLAQFSDKLENLDKLSHEELAEMAKNARERKYKL